MIECRHGWVPEGGTCMFCQIADLKKQLAAEQAKSAGIWQELLELRAERESDRQECSACYEHKVSLEATIAAMRSALDIADRLLEEAQSRLNDENFYSERPIIDQALSNTAGAEQAERVKKIEKAARVFLRQSDYVHCHSYTKTCNCGFCKAKDNLQAVLGEGKA